VLPPDALTFQAGLLASRSRHPEAMLKVLRSYFGLPVAFESNVGEWLLKSSRRTVRDWGSRATAPSAACRPKRGSAARPTPAARSGIGSTASGCTWGR
jgi:hypothetical protein